MDQRLSVFHLNALRLLNEEVLVLPGLAPAIDALTHRDLQEGIRAGVEDFLANPFVQTALSILRSFGKNYKVNQAIKLLEEAGKDYQEQQGRDRKKKRP